MTSTHTHHVQHAQKWYEFPVVICPDWLQTIILGYKPICITGSGVLFQPSTGLILLGTSCQNQSSFLTNVRNEEYTMRVQIQIVLRRLYAHSRRMRPFSNSQSRCCPQTVLVTPISPTPTSMPENISLTPMSFILLQTPH